MEKTSEEICNRRFYLGFCCRWHRGGSQLAGPAYLRICLGAEFPVDDSLNGVHGNLPSSTAIELF